MIAACLPCSPASISVPRCCIFSGSSPFDGGPDDHPVKSKSVTHQAHITALETVAESGTPQTTKVARAIAHAYSVFATGGRELGLRKETLDLLAAPAVPATRGFYDECLKGEAQFSLGFMKPNPAWPFGSARAFGSPGAGGALGFADPEAGVVLVRGSVPGPDGGVVLLRNAAKVPAKGGN